MSAIYGGHLPAWGLGQLPGLSASASSKLSVIPSTQMYSKQVHLMVVLSNNTVTGTHPPGSRSDRWMQTTMNKQFEGSAGNIFNHILNSHYILRELKSNCNHICKNAKLPVESPVALDTVCLLCVCVL